MQMAWQETLLCMFQEKSGSINLIKKEQRILEEIYLTNLNIIGNSVQMQIKEV